MTVELNIADRTQAMPHPFAHGRQTCDIRFTLSFGELKCTAHPYDLMRCERAGTYAGFLSTAEHNRPQPDRRIATQVERSDSFRSVRLMRGERHQIDIHCVHVNEQLAHALRCIDVEQHSSFATQTSYRSDVLNNAR